MPSFWTHLRRLALLAPVTGSTAFVAYCVASASMGRLGTWSCTLAVAVLIVGSGVTLCVVRRMRRVAQLVEPIAWCVALGFPAWLWWDPAPKQPLSPLGAVIPSAAEPSRDTFWAGCKGGACDRWAESVPARTLSDLQTKLDDSDAYPAFLEAHATLIEEAWQDLEDGRAWIAEMNRHTVVSDFATGVDSRILSFRAVRILTDATVHRAALQAFLGDGDAAIRTLQPLAKLAGKLRRSSRTSVTLMTTIVMDRRIASCTEFILQQGNPSMEERLALADTLDQEAGDGRDLARTIRTDIAVSVRSILAALQSDRYPDAGTDEASTAGWLGWRTGRVIQAFLFNPHRFESEAHAFATRSAELAASRDLDELGKLQDAFEAGLDDVWIKNRIGRDALAMIIPAFHAMSRQYWETQDRRRELVRQLRASAAELDDDAPPSISAESSPAHSND